MTDTLYDVDRTNWPAGPWDGEPDQVAWNTDAGLQGLAVRGAHFGAWNGYVQVPPGHLLHGIPDGRVNAWLPEGVHGGITWAKADAPVPQDSGPDGWWLGFTCSTERDVSPAYLTPDRLGIFGDTPDTGDDGVERKYRDLDFVRAEVESLARQVATPTAVPTADGTELLAAIAAWREEQLTGIANPRLRIPATYRNTLRLILDEHFPEVAKFFADEDPEGVLKAILQAHRVTPRAIDWIADEAR